MQWTQTTSAIAAALMLAAAPALAQQQTSTTEGQSGAQRQQARSDQGRARSAADRASVMNQMLADRVFVNLAESPSLGVASIRVTAEQGTVTLAGTVPSEQAAQRALRIARRTRGVQEVADQLEVRQSRSGAAAQQSCRAEDISDGALAEQVAQKLATETFPGASAEEGVVWGWTVEGPDEAWEIEVEVDGGLVTLEGDARSFSAIREAVAAAREVPCVRAVYDEMVVSGYPYYGYYGPYDYGLYDPMGVYDPYYWY